MKVERFALGACFDGSQENPGMPEQLWQEVLSVLNTRMVCGMKLYGGMAEAPEGPCYICVFMNGGLGAMRRLYRRLRAGIGSSLHTAMPFIQTNAIEKLDGLVYYGEVMQDGRITGGDAGPPALFVKNNSGRISSQR